MLFKKLCKCNKEIVGYGTGHLEKNLLLHEKVCESKEVIKEEVKPTKEVVKTTKKKRTKKKKAE